MYITHYVSILGWDGSLITAHVSSGNGHVVEHLVYTEISNLTVSIFYFFIY